MVETVPEAKTIYTGNISCTKPYWKTEITLPAFEGGDKANHEIASQPKGETKRKKSNAIRHKTFTISSCNVHLN